MLAYASATTTVVVALGISFQPVSPAADNSRLAGAAASQPRDIEQPTTDAGATESPGSPAPPEATAEAQTTISKAPDEQKVARAVTIQKMSRAQLLAQRAEELEAQLPDPAQFVISSFNVLGSSHTTGKSRMASGVSRVRTAAQLLNLHGVDVVGFQELQPDQYRSFLGAAGGAFNVYPGLAAGPLGVDNSIAWRTAEWTLVDSRTVPIPYFGGNLRPMPAVLLEHNETGRRIWVANFHNPATNSKRGNNDRHRAAAAAREVALVNQLVDETGYPVFITGDMNDREAYFCRMTGGAPMVAANGGSNDGGCNPPPYPMPVDWIFGHQMVDFSNYVRDEGPLVRRTSDHPMIRATATLDGQDGLPPASE
jgi:hypothetical protein